MNPPGKIGFALWYVNPTNGARSAPARCLTTIGGTPEAMLYQRKIVTNDQILHLVSTPLTLLSPPDAAHTLIIHRAVLTAHFTAAAYTNIATAPDSPTLSFQMNNGNILSTINDAPAAVPPYATFTLLFGSAIDANFTLEPYQDVDPNSFFDTYPNSISETTPPSAPLTLAIFNGSLGDLTGGDPANTLVLDIFYSIIPNA